MPFRTFRAAPAIFPALLLALNCLTLPLRGRAADAAELLAPARALRDAGNLPEASRAIEQLLAEVQAGEHPKAKPAALHRELGDVYAAQERAREAAEQFEKSLTAEPRQPTLHYRVGILYRRLGEHPTAADHLARAVEFGLRNTGVLFHLAAAQLESGQSTAGLENARAVLRPRAPAGDLAFRVGRLLFQHLFYRDALKAFEAAFEKSPDSYEVRLFTALTNFLLNRHDRTVTLLEPLAAPGGEGNAEAWSLLASALAALDRFEEAEALFERAVVREPSSPHAYLNLAFVLLEQGKSAAAEAWLAKMRFAAGSSSPKVFYAVRRNSCAEAERETANSPAAASIEDLADPEKGRQYFEFAQMLSGRGHHGTAVELLRMAARYEGDGENGEESSRAGLLHALAAGCLNLEPESARAPRLLKRAIELDPARHESHYLLGQAYWKQRKPAEAAEALEQAIALKPDAGSYYTELGRALAARRSPAGDDAERAAAMLSRAIEIDPADALARYELGKLWMAQGRLPAAAEQLRKAVEAETEFYEPYYVLGQIHAREKRRERAREYFEIFEKKKAAAEARSTIGKDL